MGQYKQQYSLNQNIQQHFDVISSFIPEGFEIEIKNKKYKFQSFKAFRIAPTFFHTFICQSCGGCCRRYNLIWDQFTAREFDWLNEKHLSIKINGNKHTIYYKEPNLFKKYCNLAEEKYGKVYCSEYDRRPMLSRMPHIFTKRDNRSKKILISKRHFGRNYNVKCQAIPINKVSDDFLKFIGNKNKDVEKVRKMYKYSFDENRFRTVDIPTLEFIQKIVFRYKEFDNTVIDKLINFLKQVNIPKAYKILHRVDPLVIWGDVGRWEQKIEDWLDEYDNIDDNIYQNKKEDKLNKMFMLEESK